MLETFRNFFSEFARFLIFPILFALVWLLWDTLTENALAVFYKNSFEVESVDRLSDPIGKRLSFLGPNPIEQEKSGRRRTFLATKKTSCSTMGEVFELTPLEPTSEPGSFFTIRYRRTSDTKNVHFDFERGKILYVGMTSPFPTDVCFFSNQTRVNIDYSSAPPIDTELDRSLVVMVSGLNADLDKSNLSLRLVKLLKWILAALAALFFFIIYNAISVYRNTRNDMEYRKSANDGTTDVVSKLEEISVHIKGLMRPSREVDNSTQDSKFDEKSSKVFKDAVSMMDDGADDAVDLDLLKRKML